MSRCGMNLLDGRHVVVADSGVDVDIDKGRTCVERKWVRIDQGTT